MPSTISKTKFDEIEMLLASGDHTTREIAATVVVSQGCVRKIASGEHFYQCDPAEQKRRREKLIRRKIHLPTPVEIELACAGLRAAKLPVDDDDAGGWTPPNIDTSKLGRA